MPPRVKFRGKHRTGSSSACVSTFLDDFPDAFRLMMVRIAADKALPFEPLNAEPIKGVKAARRGEISVPFRFGDELMTHLHGQHLLQLFESHKEVENAAERGIFHNQPCALASSLAAA